MSPAEARLKEMPSDISAAEWEQRINLAACYRLVALYGWDDLVDTHISARVPGPEHHFLINPYGLMFDEITASSLVKVDLDGNQLSKSEYSINPAGFTIHSAIHEAREDAGSATAADSLRGIVIVWPAYFADPDNASPMPPIRLSVEAYSGLIGEMMMRTYFESQDRRIYAVREILTRKQRGVPGGTR